MATLYAKAAGGNWSAATTWSNTGSGGGDDSGPPTAADNVIFETGSGNVTIDATAACRSLDVTSGTGTYAGTITHNSAIVLSIGDGTLGPGNVALKLDAGMTWTNQNNTAQISFVSTVTGNTITTGGEILATLLFNGIGGDWTLQDAFTANMANATLNITNGAFYSNGQTLTLRGISSTGSGVRTVDVTGSTVGLAGSNAITFTGSAANLTFVGTGSTLNITSSIGASFDGLGKTFNIVNFTNPGAAAITGANTFSTLTRTGTAIKTDTMTIAATQTVTGTLTLAGNSATNRLLVSSTVLGTAQIFTNAGAAMAGCINVDYRDITMGTAYDGSAVSSGDCGGNSGITFTTPTTRYWVGGAGSWSATSEWAATSGGGSGASVPLPQDDVVFDANSFSAGSQTCTQDMPRFAKSINWTGATNSPTWALNTSNQTMYGSLTLISAMSVSGSQALVFEGRGSFTMTSAGKQIPSVMTMSMFGGTLTLQDAFSCVSTFNLNNGTFNMNGFSVTSSGFVSNGTLTRTLTMGSGNWTLVGGLATVWNAAGSMTLTAGMTGTIFITDAGATNKLFLGGSKTYNNLTITGGGAGTVTIQNVVGFGTITCGAPKTLLFISAVTYTIKRLIAMGSSGNVITIKGATGGSAATLSQAGGVTAGDWLSIQDITFSPSAAATFYAGPNSTNVSGNTGILFKQLTGMNMTALSATS